MMKVECRQLKKAAKERMKTDERVKEKKKRKMKEII